MQCDGCRCFLRSWRLYRAQPGMDEQSKQYVGTVSLPQMFAPFTSGINYLRGGSSESLFWKWSVVKPVVHPYPRLRTNRLKFDRVSWALYLFYDKRSAIEVMFERFPHFNAHLGYKDLLEFRSESLGIDARLVPLQVKDPFSRFGKSLLQMPRSRPQWSRCSKIGIRAGRIPPQ